MSLKKIKVLTTGVISLLFSILSNAFRNSLTLYCYFCSIQDVQLAYASIFKTVFHNAECLNQIYIFNMVKEPAVIF